MHDSRAHALYLQMHASSAAIALPFLILGLAIGLAGIVMYTRTRSQVGEMRFMGLFLMVLGLVVSSLRYR
jgi:hypothetical protein